MLALTDISDDILLLYKNTKLATEELIEKISNIHEILVDSGTNLDSFSKEYDFIYIKEGVYKCFYNNKLLRFYSENDLLYIKNFPLNFSIVGEFGTTIIPFSFCSISANLLNDFINILDIENKINLYLLSVNIHNDINIQPELKLYSKGDIITNEGDYPDMIYEMISGEASVIKSDQIIGKINAGEIFGEISFLNECSRTATVVADSRCEVITIKKEIFSNLIKEKPQFLLSISKTLAKRVISLNNKITS